jgi:SAM-dependent methyltransferase
MSLNTETGRDRYFEARERELAALVDPETGRLAEHLARTIDCPLCGSDRFARLFTKQGFDFVRCEECRLVYVNPQLKESIVLDEYRTAETLDIWFDVLTSERQLAMDREKFGEVLGHLEPHRGEGRLLDVGCSIGLFLDLARERGWQTLGIEFAGRALDYARETYGLEVLEVPLEEAGFDDDAFDAVGLLSVLEHTNDPRRVLAECRRVLHPRGAVYIIVPNVESLACRILHEHTSTFDGRNHLVYFSPSTLADCLEREGFEPRLVTTKVASLDPILEWLRYERPYSDALTDDDPLARWIRGHAANLGELLDELHLGYKLHCLAVKC